MNASYWAPSHRRAAEREELLLDEILKSVTGDDGYPGDATPSRELAGRRAGHARDPQRAVAASTATGRASSTSTPSRRSCGRTASADIVVADGSPWEMGTLGALGRGARLAGRGRLPAAADGRPRSARCSSATARRAAAPQIEMFEGSGHFPPIDAAERWSALFFEFLASAE